MTTPTKWPLDMTGTTRGKGIVTTPADAEEWADKHHVYRSTHRVTMAEPAKLTESELDDAQRLKDDALKAMQREAADAQAQLTSTEGCADTGDDVEDDCWPNPEPAVEMLGRLLLLVAGVVLALAGVVALMGGK